MAQLAMPLMIASSVLSATQTIMGGLQADAAGKAQQKAARAQANDTRGLAQRRMNQQTRQGEYALSRALARGAASGGGGLETEGFSNIASDILEEARDKSMMELWQGDTQANQQEYAGDMARWQGKVKKQGAFMSAAASLLGTASSMAGKIGGAPPSPNAGAGLSATGTIPQPWYETSFQYRNL